MTPAVQPRSTTFAPVEELLLNYGLHRLQQDAHEFHQVIFSAGVKCALRFHGDHVDLNTPRRSDGSNRHHVEFGREHTTLLATLVTVHVGLVTADEGGHATSVLSVNHGVSLELRWRGGSASSVQEALTHFVRPEHTLDYQCDLFHHPNNLSLVVLASKLHSLLSCACTSSAFNRTIMVKGVRSLIV
mmetsp:Transcript_30423/g.42384  ORF Transcript_30423/g.42384 Transcript_30423/m.42384 type:complete len:187 (-) Transcript_30423:95-655(-)